MRKLALSDEEAKNNTNIARNSNDIHHLKAYSALVDNSEVLILGLPNGSAQSLNYAMRKLLTELELKQHILEKAEYRQWMPNCAPQQLTNGRAPQHGFIIELHTA